MKLSHCPCCGEKLRWSIDDLRRHKAAAIESVQRKFGGESELRASALEFVQDFHHRRMLRLLDDGPPYATD
jgi:hypothetical protein